MWFQQPIIMHLTLLKQKEPHCIVFFDIALKFFNHIQQLHVLESS